MCRKIVLLMGVCLLSAQTVRGEERCCDSYPAGPNEFAYVIFMGIESVDLNEVAPPNTQLFPLWPYPEMWCSLIYDGQPDGWTIWLVLHIADRPIDPCMEKYLYLIREGGYKRYFGQCVETCTVTWHNELVPGEHTVAVNGKAYVWITNRAWPVFDFNYDGIVNWEDWAVLTAGSEVSLETVSQFADRWLDVTV